MSAPMTRCECHEVSFDQVAAHADRHPHKRFNSLLRDVGCGQTCTACHCDLKAYLKQNRIKPGIREIVHVSPARPAPIAA